MSDELFLGKTDFDVIFDKQSVDDYICNRQVVYYFSIPMLLFFLENKRKGNSLISEMEGFISAIEIGVQHNIVPIDLSKDCIQDALNDENYVLTCLSKQLNPYMLSARTSLMYGNVWWDYSEIDTLLDNFFSR